MYQKAYWPRSETLIQGDCVAELARMPAGRIPLVFADPPFNIAYQYDVYDDRRAAEEYLDWTLAWGRAVRRVLTDSGTLWLAIGDEFAAEVKLLFQRELGLTCRSWVVWYYTFGVHCERKFARSHAHLFHFVANRHRFTFNADSVRVPSARQLVYGDRRANPAGRLPDDTWILRPQELPDGFAGDSSVWYFPRVCGTFRERLGAHPCQMPEQLLARIIRVSSNIGEVVLDPFAGSGTTLAVARKLGRVPLGIELSPSYAEAARRRLATVAEGDALDGSPEPTVGGMPRSVRRRQVRTNKSAPTNHHRR